MRLRTGPATADETAALLSLRLAVRWDEWPDEQTRSRVLQVLRAEDLRRRVAAALRSRTRSRNERKIGILPRPNKLNRGKVPTRETL